MLTVYHGMRPYLPLLACVRHIRQKDNKAADSYLALGSSLDWRRSPLLPTGLDNTGFSVYCLVHGKHRDLYLRALEGTAAIFGLDIKFVDVDNFVMARARQDIKLLPAALVGRYAPDFLSAAWQRQLGEVIESKIN